MPMQASEEQFDTLRACLNKIYDVCDEMESQGASVELGGQRITVRKLFEVETTAYMLYLTIADRIIDEDEVETINKIMGRSYSMQDCMSMVEAHGMRDPNFGERTPASFKLLCSHAGQRGPEMADTLIAFYDVLGVVMASADGEYALPEETARIEYLRLLRGYKALVQPEGADE